MKREEWRTVSIAPDYEVSDRGRVRSRRGGKSPYVMSPTVTPDGHLRIGLSTDGPKIQIFVHRLVATAFIGPQPIDQPITRHLDGDPANNVPSNLAWGTVRENELDKVAHGVHPNTVKTQCPSGHPYTPENTYFRGEGWRMCRECSRERTRQWRAVRRQARAA